MRDNDWTVIVPTYVYTDNFVTHLELRIAHL
jgi:hypothetical protein